MFLGVGVGFGVGVGTGVGIGVGIFTEWLCFGVAVGFTFGEGAARRRMVRRRVISIPPSRARGFSRKPRSVEGLLL